MIQHQRKMCPISSAKAAIHNYWHTPLGSKNSTASP